MKANAVLQIIFAFFLGLVVLAFVGIGVNTFYPSPDYPVDVTLQDSWSEMRDRWALVTGIVLLLCATVLLAVSLYLPEHQAVLSNGILLGGVFTLVYAVGMTFSADTSLIRFVVVTAALVIAIGAGYLKFVRGRGGPRGAAKRSAQAEQPDSAALGELGDRVAAVEHKLDALGRALHE